MYIEKDNPPIVNYETSSNPLFDKKLDYLKGFSSWDDEVKVSLFNSFILTINENSPIDINTVKYEEIFKNPMAGIGGSNKAISQMRLRFGREYAEIHYQLSRYASNYVCLEFCPIFSDMRDIEMVHIPDHIKNQIKQFAKENYLFDLSNGGW